MTIRMDRAMCQGHTLANAAEQSIFTLNGHGYSDAGGREVRAGMEGQARKGWPGFPERAITLEE